MNNDLISRKALNKALEETPYNDIDDLIRTVKLINNAPAVEPEQSKWVIYGKQGDIPITDMCQKCHYEMKWYKNKYNFCPDCGAKMINGNLNNWC